MAGFPTPEALPILSSLPLGFSPPKLFHSFRCQGSQYPFQPLLSLHVPLHPHPNQHYGGHATDGGSSQGRTILGDQWRMALLFLGLVHNDLTLASTIFANKDDETPIIIDLGS
jgi:hypothetical protein